MPIDKIKKLTLQQIYAIYGHPTDDNGSLSPIYNGPEPPQPSARDHFDAVWKSRGIDGAAIEILWQEHKEVEKARASLEKKYAKDPDMFDRVNNELRTIRAELKRNRKPLW